jgi:hypothetical protein
VPFVGVPILARKLFHLCIQVLNELLQLNRAKLLRLCCLEHLIVVATSIEDQSFCILAHLHSFIYLHTDLLYLSRFRSQGCQLLVYLNLAVRAVTELTAELFLQIY